MLNMIIYDILTSDQLPLMNLFCLCSEIQRKLPLSRWFLLNCPERNYKMAQSPFKSSGHFIVFTENYHFHIKYVNFAVNN